MKIKYIFLLLFFCVCESAFSNIIKVEAESFKGKSAIRKNRSGHSGNSFVGKFSKISNSIEIPKSGIWYVWVRYNQVWQNWATKLGESTARQMRSFKLSLNNSSEVFDSFASTPWAWSRKRVALNKGKVALTLEAVGVDPYIDLLIFTQDENYIPPRKFSRKEDEIEGIKVIPKSSYNVKVPRSNKYIALSSFVIKGGAKSKYNSTTFLRHDGKNLFVKIVCEQPKDTLKLHNGALWYQDGVELVLDGNRSLDKIRHIIVTPDNKIFSEQNGVTWQCDWKRKTKINKDNWTVEVVVPLVDLLDEFPLTPGVMRANFCRTIQHFGEYSSWVPYGKGFLDPLTCGELLFENMTYSEWVDIYLGIVNNKAISLGVKALPKKSSIKDILEFEKKLTTIIQKKFAAPKGKQFVFEKTNLIPNPNFEYGKVNKNSITPINWLTNKASDVTIANGGYKNTNALRINPSAGATILRANVKPYIDSTFNYEWTGLAKCDTKGDKLTLKINWFVLDPKITDGWGGNKKYKEDVKTIYPSSKWTNFSWQVVPPKGAVNCTFEIITKNNKGNVWCDNFSFDGMNNLQTEFILPQNGFDLQATKQVIIWSKVPLKGKVNLYKDKKQVAQLKLIKWGKSRWKGDVYNVNLSSIKIPGNYYLTCNAENKIVKSHDFIIKKDLYIELAKFASNFYYVQRQGVDVPNWHKANFLDDAVIVDKKTKKVIGHRDVSGGWQDAGDPSKQAPSDLSIYGLSEFFENTQLSEYKLKEKYPDILSLAWQEVYRQVYKCYVGEGKFIGITVNNMNNVRFHHPNAEVTKYKTRPIHNKTPDKWTDNIPGTWDDRYITGPGSLQWMVSGLGKFAYSIKKYDLPVAKKIIQILIEDYSARQARQVLWKNNFYERIARGDGELAKVAMYLYLLTGKKNYLENLDNHIGEILKVYQAKLYSSKKKCLLNSAEERYNFFNQSMGLFDYLRYFPNGKHANSVKKELKAFIEYLYLRSQDNEFGIVDYVYIGPGFRLTAPQWYKEENGSNRRIARLGYLAARAARVFKEPKYLEYADKAAQYIIGRNPKNISMLIGNGWKFSATATTLRFCEGHSDGVIPGAVVRGMTTQLDSPEDYPAINVSSNPGGSAIGVMHEVWQEDTNAFILLCQELHMARKN